MSNIYLTLKFKSIKISKKSLDSLSLIKNTFLFGKILTNKLTYSKTNPEIQIESTIFINIVKPAKQFFITFSNKKLYSYSTGLLINAFNNGSRSIRRVKNGFLLLMSFLSKKILTNTHALKNKNIMLNLKGSQNINLIKTVLLKNISKVVNKTILMLNIKKNYSKHGYKKISYINKRMRKRFIIE